MTVTQTLQSAASNIDKFANAGDDPIGAVQGALNMVGQFAALAGPKSHIVAVALSFVSGFLSLFGAGGKKKKSIGQIVREEIDEALGHFTSRTSVIRLEVSLKHLTFRRHMWIGLLGQAISLLSPKQGHLREMYHCILALNLWEHCQVR